MEIKDAKKKIEKFTAEIAQLDEVCNRVKVKTQIVRKKLKKNEITLIDKIPIIEETPKHIIQLKAQCVRR